MISPAINLESNRGGLLHCPAALAQAAVESVAAEYGIPVFAIMGRYRRPRTNEARNAAYAAVRALGWSYPRIGRFFRRDHTTVFHGVKRHLEGANAVRELLLLGVEGEALVAARIAAVLGAGGEP